MDRTAVGVGCHACRMTLITGFATTKRAPVDAVKAGRRVAPAPVVIGTGTAHAVHDDFVVHAFCGETIITTVPTPWATSPHAYCAKCLALDSSQ